jgi:hypothetical protein
VAELLLDLTARAQNVAGGPVRSAQVLACATPSERALLPIFRLNPFSVGVLLARAADVELGGRILRRHSYGGFACWRVVPC